MGSKATFLVWLLVFCSAVGAFLFVAGAVFGWNEVPDSFSHLIDDGPVTRAILFVFAIGLLINFGNTIYVVRQLSAASAGIQHEQLPDRVRLAGKGLLGTHVARLQEMFGERPSNDVNQTSSLGAIRNQLYRREWIVRSASGLLLTLGLVGTVLGLTNSLGGLSSTVNAVALETLEKTDKVLETEESKSGELLDESASTQSSGVSDGLNQALGGMATAFITTLFGAVLGGIFLKLLCNCTDCLTEELVDQIEQITEARVIPMLRVSPDEILRRQQEAFTLWATQMEAVAAKECERLSEVSEQLATITQRFGQLSHAIAEAETRLAGSRTHLAMLSGWNSAVSRLESLTGSRATRLGLAAGCVIAVVGLARFVLDIVF